MQKVLIGIIGFFALLVGLIVVVPGMIDWNTYKSDITNQVERLTGRKLTIDGNVEITVLPAPAVIVNDVSFANAPGSSSEQMVRLRSLEVRVVLGPLISGDIQVQKVKVVDPVVLLEISADGKPNWDIAPKASSSTSIELGADGQSATASPTDGGPGIQLDNVEVVNATIIYNDETTGTTERIEQLDATFKAGSLQGPFESVGDMVIRRIPISYEVATDGIFQGRTVPVTAIIRSESGDAETRLSGNVLNLDDVPRFKGNVSVAGTSFAALLNALTGAQGLPGTTNQAFEFSGEVDASATSASLADITIKLGDISARGNVTAEIGDTIVTSSEFTIKHINVDTLLALEPYIVPSATEASDTLPEPETANEQSETSGETASVEATPTIPGNVSATTSLVVDALTLRGEKAGPVRVNAELGNSEITISQFSAQLPGATDVAVFGFVNEQDGSLMFEGDSEIAIGDTRRLARWLDVDASQIPKGRLRHVSISSKILATPEQVQISGINAAFDNSNLSGGVTFALRNRLAFGASFTLDRIDLDGYLPASDSKAEAQDSVNTTSSPETETATTTAVNDQINPLAALNVLTTFDANLRINVGELIHNDVSVANVALSSTLYNGDLSLENFSVGDVAGASAEIKGGITDLGGNPKFNDLSLGFDAKSVARLFTMLQVEPPLPPKAIGRVTIDAILNGSALQPAIAGTFGALGAKASINGRLSVLPIKPSIDADVTLTHGDTARLLRSLGISYQPSGKIGGLTFSGHVRGGAEGIDLTDMDIAQGPVNAKGTASVALTTTRPKVMANIRTNDVVIDSFLPAGASQSTSSQSNSGQQSNTTSNTEQTVPSGAPWSKEPIDLGALRELDADIQLQSTALRYESVAMKNTAVAVTLLDGVLTASNISAHLFGGELAINGVLNAQSIPSMQTGFNFKNGNVAGLLSAFTGEPSAVGNLTLGGNFATTGSSVDALAQDLDGKGTFSVKGLDVKGDARGTPLAGIMDLVRAIGQLGGSFGGQETDGLADVSGSFTMTDGVAQISDFSLASGFGNGTASGYVDLGGWNLDVAGELKLTQNLLTAILAKSTGTLDKLPFSVRGVLDSPTVDLDTGSLLSSGDGILLPGLDKLEEKVLGLGAILQGVLGGGSSQNSGQQKPTTESGDDSETPEPQSQEQAPAQQELTPEAILEQLFNF